MRRSPTPVFLERRTYRRRRLMDAARLLPVIGAVLFLVPILWMQMPGDGPGTARAAVYVFCVWAGLIVLAVWVSRRLSDGSPTGEEREGRERPE